LSLAPFPALPFAVPAIILSVGIAFGRHAFAWVAMGTVNVTKMLVRFANLSEDITGSPVPQIHVWMVFLC